MLRYYDLVGTIPLAITDLLGGQIQFMFPDVASAIGHIRAGKLRAIAVNQATPLLPGVPTLAQAGFPLDVFTSFSVVAPAGTPEPVIARLGSEIARAMRSGPVAETAAGAKRAYVVGNGRQRR